MKPVRISLSVLMIGMAFLGLGFAALAKPSEMGAHGVFTVSVVFSGIAFLGMVFRLGGNRSCWIGYFLGSGAYLLLCFGPWFVEAIEPHLITSRLCDEWYDRLSDSPTEPGEPVWVYHWPRNYHEARFHPEEIRRANVGSSPTFVVGDDRYPKFSEEVESDSLRPCSNEMMHRLVHSLLAILIGLIGATLAVTLTMGSRRRISKCRDRS